MKKKDMLDEIFLETEKEKKFYKELQDEKRKHGITEENRVILLNENLELKGRLRKLSKIDKLENSIAYLERIVLQLYRLTGNEVDKPS